MEIGYSQGMHDICRTQVHVNGSVELISLLFTASVFAGLLLRSATKQDLVEKRKTKEFFQHFLVQSPSDSGIHDKLSG